MSARELTLEQIENIRLVCSEYMAGLVINDEPMIDRLCDMALASLEPVAMPEPVAWRYRHELGLGTGRWPDEWELCKKEPVERATTFHIQYEPLYTAARGELSDARVREIAEQHADGIYSVEIVQLIESAIRLALGECKPERKGR